jgi:UDP-glucose 4-epimerase
MSMNVLVTGGTGYIGSHTVVELLNAKHNVIIVDNFSNSSSEVLTRIEKITGRKPKFYYGDVQDRKKLNKIFQENRVEAVIHFAGLKSIGESVKEPLAYYHNNIVSTLTLLEVMKENSIKQLIFSSSAAVYGQPETLPLTETSRVGVGITNPYGRTKYMIEEILNDLLVSDRRWAITSLRYFNPIGAHVSGLIGEDPNDIPNNLLPYITQVAVGKLDKLKVFGNDYDTPDGTGIRDYIHVVDLAKGHVAALEWFKASDKVDVYNLGTGKGASVMEVLHAFEKTCGKTIPYEIAGQRPGDIASCYADVSNAKAKLKWQTKKTLEEACVDSWRWQSQNPDGYTK